MHPLQVKRDYRTPEGMDASEVDADSDGDVLAVLDLRVDSELTSAGHAREIVNRYGGVVCSCSMVNKLS